MPESVRAMKFVLGKFTAPEKALLKNALQKAEEAMITFALKGVDMAMNVFN
jgi:peptidyl-tRNA hydrolase